MTLAIGARLGPDEVLAPVGAGGMGEVYRARDMRLGRDVAIKALPPHLSSSPQIRQRFEREAKTISQLSHPHICALYDVGREGQTEYLVMELLEGEMLSDRLLPLFGDRRPFPFLRTEAGEMGGQISPNGRWMGYSSNESGAYEVYVRPFPPAPGKWQVSREGGSQLRWRRDGKELFYLSTDRKMMAVDVKTDQPGFEAGVPKALFETHVGNIEGSNPWNQYSVTADGRHFLVNRLAAETTASPINIILNWPAAEKK